ncbi:uncharacterized protein LOC141607091 [Silene latifolia]|uniref:uncharacterized protein LOC141607091 n=1 Tax=Silene latifolia TaxID=37657 RepID=UPI003D770E93
MRDCGGVGEIWDELGVERMEGVGFGTTRDWAEEMIKGMGMRECTEFMTSCWAIWEDRNILVFEGEGGGIVRVARRVRELLWEMQMSASQCADRGGQEKGRREEGVWTKPKQGSVKVNVDAAVLDGIGRNRSGVAWGCVGRDENGRVRWCTVTQQRSEMSVAMAEAMGIWHGMHEAIRNEQLNIEVESDCAVVVEALQRKTSDMSDLQLVYDDIYLLCNSFHSVCFSFTRRKNNMVAHKLAHFGLRTVDIGPTCAVRFDSVGCCLFGGS